MALNNAKYDWDAMLDAAKAKPGEYVLAFEGVPYTIRKRIRARDAAALKGLPENALSVSHDNLTVVDGVEHADIWVRWNLDESENLLPGVRPGEGLRKRSRKPSEAELRESLIQTIVATLQDRESGAGSDMRVGDYDGDSWLEILSYEDPAFGVGSLDVGQLADEFLIWAKANL